MILRILVAALLAVVLSGCGDKGPKMYPVSGTVKFDDGSIPTGEIRVIRFEPASFASGTPDPSTKAAQATINPDGTYKLSTVEADDGAREGDYKVTFTIRETYRGTDSVIDEKFTTAAKTPHSATVKAGGDNRFDFVIEKKK
jgi:major membrane immunogen (membrane-anchored lipoprotein)